MAAKPLIKESLEILNICGLNPMVSNAQTRIKAALTIVLACGFIAESFMGLLLNWKGMGSVDAVAEFVGFYQILSKIVTVLLKRRELMKVFSTIENSFWSLNKCSEELKTQITSTNSSIRKFFIITLIASCITLLVFSAKPFVSSIRMLPINTYHPSDLSKTTLYGIAYFIQVAILTAAITPSLLGFDFLFISLITHIINELRMISEGFEMIAINDEESEDEEYVKELNLLIDHHNLVFECIKYMNGIYSFLLLNQFLTCTFLICTGLLVIVTSDISADLQNFVKAIGYLLVYSSLLFSYCNGGAYLTTKSHSVAGAIFNSNWWTKARPKLRQSVIIVLCRSQKTEKLTAGGMFDLNLETFTSVIKTALSFFMVAQAIFIKTKKNS